MKTRKCIFPLLLLLAMTLCGCNEAVISSSSSTDARTSKTEVWRSVAWFQFPFLTALHGEDYVIEWEDAGMEAHIRFLLDKPEGDILHSDVWEVRILTIEDGSDILLDQLPEGWDEFSYSSVTGNREIRQFTEGTIFPPVKSLRDLRHFDSLQMFEMYLDIDTAARHSANQLTDLSGLEQCGNLKVLQLCNARPETLAPIAEMQSLDTLFLAKCGSLDLTPLENLPLLSRVSLRGSDAETLEPLATLPSLNYLCLSVEATYPSLEPLTHTTLQYLDMGLSVDGRKMYGDLDYEPLTRIPNLVYLDVTNHQKVDADLCAAILAGNPNLRYLDISYTPAAKRASKLHTENLEIFIAAPD